MSNEELDRKALGRKLREARDLLGISMGEAGRQCGLRQRDISQLEKGEKAFVPTGYLHYLAYRIDLNSIFNPDLPVSRLSTYAVTEEASARDAEASARYRKAMDVFRELEELKERVAEVIQMERPKP